MRGKNESTEEWEPFVRPLFEDSSARARERVVRVDVGSNALRKWVVDGRPR